MQRATRTDVEKLLRRLVNGGPIRRLPKSRKDTDLFLALAASVLDPRAAYAETEINEALQDWMREFTCPINLDHVTIRRYLVDHRFVLREETGTNYRTNQAIINSVIEPDARSVEPQLIFRAVQEEREQRKLAVRSD
jgi:hypothetical protein